MANCVSTVSQTGEVQACIRLVHADEERTKAAAGAGGLGVAADHELLAVHQHAPATSLQAVALVHHRLSTNAHRIKPGTVVAKK